MVALKSSGMEVNSVTLWKVGCILFVHVSVCASPTHLA
jgi:hypothetical protein